MKIGFIGNGFVGGTTYTAMLPLSQFDYEFLMYDKVPEKSKNTLEEVAKCEIIFVCLPTPMILETGQCYTGFVEKAIKEVRKLNKKNWIIIKSTVPPGTTKEFDKKYGKICFSPEFLTEKNPLKDVISQPYQMIGFPNFRHTYYSDQEIENSISQKIILLLENFLKYWGHSENDVHITTSTNLEMVKYTRNCYLATRLSFFNEIALLCEDIGADYRKVKKMVGLDERIGDHYNNVVPGNEGWGGHCLPKDLQALAYVASQINYPFEMFKAAWDSNINIRPNNRDWEEQIGRAVISLKDIDKNNI